MGLATSAGGRENALSSSGMAEPLLFRRLPGRKKSACLCVCVCVGKRVAIKQLGLKIIAESK